MQTKKKWYRKWVLDVPREVVVNAVATYTKDPENYCHSTLEGPYVPDDTVALKGKTLTLRGEGHVFAFTFGDLHELKFAEDNGEAKACFANVKTMDNEIYFVNFLVPGYEMGRQITLVADTRYGSATVCDAHFGTENSNIDVGREFIFGKLDGEYEEGPMHEFTNELVGKAIEWDYGKLVIKHIYSSNLYYTYSHPGGNNGAWMSTNPADYIKVRDNLYIFSFVEERQHGLQALFLIDLNTYHDVGCFFGVHPDHVTSACIGAHGVPADLITLF